MTEFEVNKRLAELLGVKTHDKGSTGGSFLLYGEMNNNLEHYYPTLDYCNDPSDMWPVIVDLKILVSPVVDMDGDVSDLWIAVKPWRTGNSEICHFEEDVVSHKSPLTAAALVAIKVLEDRL